MNEIRLGGLIAPAFHPVHADLRRGAHAEYWLMGGRGSGKSSFVSLEIVLGIMRDPQANAAVYRHVAGTLRQSVHAQLWWAVRQLGAQRLWRQSVSPLSLTYLPTGQRIVFLGADDPQKSKGLKPANGFFKYLWFEELAEFEGMDAVRTIKASVIRGGGAVTFYTYNPPQSAASWVNREALCAHPGRLTHQSTYLDMPPAWLGESFLSEAARLRDANERAWRHMYLGQATGTGGQVFENLRLRPITPQDLSRMGAFYDGLDFGYWPDPSHWVRVSYDAANRIVYVVDELRRYRTGDRELAAALKAEKGLTRATEIICDSASEKPLADLRAEGLRATGAMKGFGSVEAGLRWLITRAAIVIDPERTPDTAREFLCYERVRDRDGAFAQAYPDRDNHAIDAVRYALNRVWIRRDR